MNATGDTTVTISLRAATIKEITLRVLRRAYKLESHMGIDAKGDLIAYGGGGPRDDSDKRIRKATSQDREGLAALDRVKKMTDKEIYSMGGDVGLYGSY